MGKAYATPTAAPQSRIKLLKRDRLTRFCLTRGSKLARGPELVRGPELAHGQKLARGLQLVRGSEKLSRESLMARGY